jgi:hypothetical protein
MQPPQRKAYLIVVRMCSVDCNYIKFSIIVDDTAELVKLLVLGIFEIVVS